MSTQNVKATDSIPLIKNDTPSFSVSQQDNITMTEEEEELVRKKQRRSALYRQIKMFLLMFLIDIAIPLGLYYVLKLFISELIALIISGVPPLLHVIINFIMKRRVEVIGCICIFSFILSAILTLITGDARLAVLRDSTTTAVISVAFFITLIPLRTPWFQLYPLTFLVAQQLMSEIPVDWTDNEGVQHSMSTPEFFWIQMPAFRRHSYIWTTIWGTSLMVEFIVKLIMIFATSLTVDELLLYGTISSSVILAITCIASTVASVRLRKQCGVFYKEWFKANDYSTQFKGTTGDDNNV